MTPRRARRWLPWLALAAIAVIALGVGAQRASGNRSVEQETMVIAGQIRCPVCEGETAAESNTVASAAIRSEIRKDLLAGERPAAILAGLAAVYGPGSLEKPRTSGVDLLLWVVPAAVAALAIAGLVALFAFWRQSRQVAVVTDAERALVAGALSASPAATPPARRGSDD